MGLDEEGADLDEVAEAEEGADLDGVAGCVADGDEVGCQ